MISIAMATYNGEKYLPQQLDSILDQTITNIEIIICDDNSSDSTWSILQSYAAKDSRIHCYQNETNLGFKKNFEKAILLCKGDFIALSDQDDIWKKEHLEILANTIGSYDIACGDASLIDSNGNDLHQTLSNADFFYKVPKNFKDFAYRIFFNSSCFQGASMLIKREFFESAMPIPQGVLYHDAWFAVLACFHHGLTFSQEIVTFHRRHGNNVSQRTPWKNYFNRIYLKRNQKKGDRYSMAEAIEKRLGNTLTLEQKKFLTFIHQYGANRLSRIGKIKNCIFRLTHHSQIYTTSSRIFLEW